MLRHAMLCYDRPTLEERSKLAGIIHAWRETVQADTILQQLPANFDWFQKHLVLRPLLKTQQGHMVVLLKVSVLHASSAPCDSAAIYAQAS